MAPPSEKPNPNAVIAGSAIRSAMIWNFTSMAFAQIALAAVFLLLAARLDPTTFGVFALAAVLTDVFYTLGTSSAVDAIVQRNDYSRRTLSTITWLMMVISIGATLAFLIGSGFYATAIDVPQVTGVLEALSLTTLMLPFVIGPTAIMRQRMDFKGLAMLGMISSFAGSLAALAAAYTSLIEWSLVIQRFVTTIVMVTLATMRTRSIPTLAFDKTAARTWFGAAARIFTGQGVAAAAPRALDLLMGLLFGVAAVGYLRVASKLSDMVLGLLVNPIAQMWVVLLTRAKEAGDAGRTIFLQLSSLTALIALPGFVGLALVSEQVVALLLPPDYAPVADMLAMLCALGIFVPLTNPRSAVLTALRKFDHLVWYSLLDFSATLLALAVFSSFGPVIMLSGGAFSSIVLISVATPVILRELGTSPGELASKLTHPYIAVTAMALVVLAIRPLIHDVAPLPSLLIQVAVGGGVYVGVLAVFFRRSVFEAFKVVAAR